MVKFTTAFDDVANPSQHKLLIQNLMTGSSEFAWDAVAFDTQPVIKAAYELGIIPEHMRTNPSVAILGTGFSGTVAAAHIVSRAYDRRNGLQLRRYGSTIPGFKVHCIEKDDGKRYGGEAYSPKAGGQSGLKLNIPYVRTSPDPASQADIPSIRVWLGRYHRDFFHRTNVQDQSIPRHLYQEYLEYVMDNTRNMSNRDDIVETGTSKQRAIDIEINGSEGTIHFDDGSTLTTDQIVLANGHGTPKIPKFAKNVAETDRFLPTPWTEEGREFMASIPEDASVMILGKGLTSYDVGVTLLNQMHRGQIIMTSRRNVRPPTYNERQIPPGVPAQQNGSGFNQGEVSLVPRFLDVTDVEVAISVMKTQWRQLRQAGILPEQILSAWEGYVPEIARDINTSGDENRQKAIDLFREFQSVIGINRVGVVASIGDRIESAIETDRIQAWTSQITNMTRGSGGRGGIDVTYTQQTPDGDVYQKTRHFDYVISGLGFENDYSKVQDPLWQNLYRRGYVRNHWTGIGIDTTYEGRVVGADGRASSVISAVGPMRAGQVMVTAYDYVEKPGFGGRLGPFTLNIPGIASTMNELAFDVVRQAVRNYKDHFERHVCDDPSKAGFMLADHTPPDGDQWYALAEPEPSQDAGPHIIL